MKQENYKQIFKINNPGGVITGTLVGFILSLLLITIGLFAYWAFSFSTHTLVWLIFIFGSVLGSVRIKSK